jgi:hypothetical protein
MPGSHSNFMSSMGTDSFSPTSKLPNPINFVVQSATLLVGTAEQCKWPAHTRTRLNQISFELQLNKAGWRHARASRSEALANDIPLWQEGEDGKQIPTCHAAKVEMVAQSQYGNIVNE